MVRIYAGTASSGSIQELITANAIPNDEILKIFFDSEQKIWYLIRLSGGGGMPVTAYMRGLDIATGNYVTPALQELFSAPGYYGLIAITDLTLSGDVYISNIRVGSVTDHESTAHYLRVANFNTGGGNDFAQVVGIGGASAGGIIPYEIGQQVRTASFPVTLSVEDVLVLDGIDTTLTTISGTLTTIDGKLPDWSTATVGRKDAVASIPTVLSNEDALVFTTMSGTLATIDGTLTTIDGRLVSWATAATAPFVKITDGVNNLTLGAGAVKTIPSEIHDGTTGADVIAIINSLKTDTSSIGGTVVDVNSGNKSNGSQRVVIATDDVNVSAIRASLEVIDDWDATEGSPIGNDGSVIMLEAKSSQKAEHADGDAVRPVANLRGEQVIAGHSWSTNSNRSEEISPINLAVLEENFIDTTNVAANTNYYPSSLGRAMLGYKDFSITGSFIDADGTITWSVEATNDEDPVTADWIQIYGYDAKNNTTVNSMTFTNSSMTFAWDFDNLNYRFVRVKVVNDGATNTFILKSRMKAL